MKIFWKILTPLVILSLVVFVMPKIANADISRLAAQTATGTGTTNVTATYPGIPTQNNLLIATLFSIGDNTGGSPTTVPAGWVQAASSGTASSMSWIYYKIAGSSEPTGVTFGDTNGTNIFLAVYEYTGNVSASPIDKISSNICFIGLSCSTGTTAALSQSSELAIGLVTYSATQTFSSWSNGYSALTSLSGHLFSSQFITSSTGAQSSTLTVTGTSAGAAGSIATFKATLPLNHAQVTINSGLVTLPKGITTIN